MKKPPIVCKTVYKDPNILWIQNSGYLDQVPSLGLTPSPERLTRDLLMFQKITPISAMPKTPIFGNLRHLALIVAASGTEGTVPHLTRTFGTKLPSKGFMVHIQYWDFIGYGTWPELYGAFGPEGRHDIQRWLTRHLLWGCTFSPVNKFPEFACLPCLPASAVCLDRFPGSAPFHLAPTVSVHGPAVSGRVSEICLGSHLASLYDRWCSTIPTGIKEYDQEDVSCFPTGMKEWYMK